MRDLRKAIIKLAKRNPELRKDLLPLIRRTAKEAPSVKAPSLEDFKKDLKSVLEGKGKEKEKEGKTAMEHPSEDALKKYLKEHPGADPKNHTVSEGGGKGKGKKEKGEDLKKKSERLEASWVKKFEAGEATVKDMTHAVAASLLMKFDASSPEERKEVVNNIKNHVSAVGAEMGMTGSNKEIVKKMYDEVEYFQDEKANQQNAAQVQQVSTIGAYLQVLIKAEGAKSLGLPEGASFEAPDEVPKSKKRPKSKKGPKLSEKERVDKAEGIGKKYGITRDDLWEFEDFKNEKDTEPGRKGRKVSPVEKMNMFMRQATPEMKKRLKKMSTADFMAMLSCFGEEEGE